MCTLLVIQLDWLWCKLVSIWPYFVSHKITEKSIQWFHVKFHPKITLHYLSFIFVQIDNLFYSLIFEIKKFQTFLVKYKANRNHFNKCARKFQIYSLRNYYTNFIWRNDATNSQLIWRKATASSEYSVNFGLEIDSFGLYCPFYLICTAFWNVSKSPWNSIFFLWFYIDVTCATASSAEIDLLVLFKQNTYFGSRSQTRWWNGVSLISNSSDKFKNSAIFFNENVDKNE